jgi:glycosyltransferase involved in cell wall biosynthesis
VHSLVIGGTERVVCDLTRHFNDGRFRTLVCCLDDLGEFGKDLAREGIPVQVFNRKPGMDYNLIRELRRLYGGWKIDVVHAHQYTPYFYGAVACLGSSAPKVILTEHGRHQPDRIRPKRVVFNQVFRPVTAGYTAVSDFTRRSLMKFEKMPGSRIRVIYNGVPYHKVGSSPGKKYRETLGIAMDRKIALSVGRMDPIKDFPTLIRAFEDVVRSMPDALLLIAGGGDGKYMEELRTIAKQVGIEDQVTFLGNRRDVTELLGACDVFALTSISEAASMTILEAMAAGRPVVATNTGGNPELVADSKTGYLVPVGDRDAISEKLSRLIADNELASRMGDAGRVRFEELFTHETMMASYRDLYEEVLFR